MPPLSVGTSAAHQLSRFIWVRGYPPFSASAATPVRHGPPISVMGYKHLVLTMPIDHLRKCSTSPASACRIIA